MTTLAALRRTPGIVFQSIAQPAQPELPPLDVAGFIGFATRGPCDVAVPVEDLAGYDAIFGPTPLPLARAAAGPPVVALLRDAVAGFFSAGGRRCHIVRVAGIEASSARFAVPGLLALDKGAASVATVEAAWPGTWSDDTRIATILEATPLPPAMFQRGGDATLAWDPASAPTAVEAGDVLRLTYGASRYLFPVASVVQATPQWSLSASLVFRSADGLTASLAGVAVAATLLSAEAELPLDALLTDGVLHLIGAGAARVAVGDVLRITVPGGPQSLVAVSAIAATAADERVVTPGEVIELGDADTAIALPSGQPDRIERLCFALRVKDGTGSERLLDDLGCNAGHSRFWSDVLPRESGALAGATFDPGQATTIYDDVACEVSRPLDWTDARLRAVASAQLAPARSDPIYLPLGMATVGGDLIGPIVGGANALASFDAQPFIDTALAHAFPPANVEPPLNPRALMLAAADRAFVQNLKLKGMYALLFVDEISLICVPDAVQPGWQSGAQSEPPPIAVDPPAQQVVPGFRDCPPALAIASVTPAVGTVRGGTKVTISGSGFGSPTSPQVSFGSRTVSANDTIVQDDTRIACVTPPAAAIGTTDVTVRAMGQSATLAGAFSYIADITSPDLPLASDPAGYDVGPLITVQAALAVLCQARADAVAVMALPRHFEKRECIDWLQRLRTELGLPIAGPASLTDPQPDRADLSYVVVYHPWLLTPATLADTPAQKVLPPDGAACGLIAARELARQAWIAPANLAVPGVLDLEPAISDADWADLFAQGFNLVRAEAKDFRVMSAHTLADDASLLQLSVRRLMIQIRKAVLERGNAYVFENNTAAFRQSVRSGIEALLRFMFARGAFAGAAEPQSFSVAVDDDLNTPQRIADGQMIARILVAPSQPMEFITVLLSRNAEGALQAAER